MPCRIRPNAHLLPALPPRIHHLIHAPALLHIQAPKAARPGPAAGEVAATTTIPITVLLALPGDARRDTAQFSGRRGRDAIAAVRGAAAAAAVVTAPVPTPVG